MGYRSSIYIKVVNSELFTLKKVLEDTKLISEFTFTQDDTYLYAVAYRFKWYSSYPEVSAVNTYINSLASGIGAMITIGEDGASESYNDTWEVDLSIVTQIDGFKES